MKHASTSDHIVEVSTCNSPEENCSQSGLKTKALRFVFCPGTILIAPSPFTRQEIYCKCMYFKKIMITSARSKSFQSPSPLKPSTYNALNEQFNLREPKLLSLNFSSLIIKKHRQPKERFSSTHNVTCHRRLPREPYFCTLCVEQCIEEAHNALNR